MDSHRHRSDSDGQRDRRQGHAPATTLTGAISYLARASDSIARLEPADWAAIAVAAAAFSSPAHLSGGPVLCPIRRLTGRPCPVCGMSRSWSSLAHLRLRNSLEFHPLGPLTFVGAVWLAGSGDSKRMPAALSSPPLVGALAAVWLLVWLRRAAGVRPA